jgi:hypothetical protein
MSASSVKAALGIGPRHVAKVPRTDMAVRRNQRAKADAGLARGGSLRDPPNINPFCFRMSGAFSAVIVIVGSGLQQLALALVMLVILIFRPSGITGGREVVPEDLPVAISRDRSGRPSPATTIG